MNNFGPVSKAEIIPAQLGEFAMFRERELLVGVTMTFYHFEILPLPVFEAPLFEGIHHQGPNIIYRFFFGSLRIVKQVN